MGESHYQIHEYVAWCFRDDLGEYGPLQTFDVPFIKLGTRYPRCPDGEVTDPGSSAEESASSDGVPVEYKVDEFEPMDIEPDDGDVVPEPMEQDDEEPEPVGEDPVLEAESETDSLGSEEEMPDSSSSSESSYSNPDRAP